MRLNECEKHAAELQRVFDKAGLTSHSCYCEVDSTREAALRIKKKD